MKLKKRSLKNINHWIAELRDIAMKTKLYGTDDNGKNKHRLTK